MKSEWFEYSNMSDIMSNEIKYSNPINDLKNNSMNGLKKRNMSELSAYVWFNEMINMSN